MSSETVFVAEKPPSPRERILQVAGRLFYLEGYRAVGIDRVIAEADLFHEGGHGFGVRLNAGKPAEAWPALVLGFGRRQGWIRPPR